MQDCSARELFLQRLSSLNHPQQYYDDSNDKQKVNDPPGAIANKSNKPRDDQYDCYDVE